ncbi:GNAT family N-acetyltransferase [Candidatus Bipolaricaulota bacterium]
MSTKRTPMSLRLTPQTTDKKWLCRQVRETDAKDLAILMYAAFRGTPDDDGETFTDAVKEIDKTFAGDYGSLLLDCSFLIQDADVVSSACLVSWYEPTNSPFVVFTMTRPETKGHGMARFLLGKSINALIGAGYEQLTLIVTEGNEPAQKLYASLGFCEIAAS